MKHIKEYILEYLSNTSIFEMAFSRKELIKRVEGLYGQIIENWVLIKYSTLSGNTTYKEHWKDELSAHMGNIFGMYYKGDKEWLLKQILIDKLEITTSRKIRLITLRKIRKEKIDDNDINYIKACDLCSEDILEICRLLSLKETEENLNNIYDYIDSI